MNKGNALADEHDNALTYDRDDAKTNAKKFDNSHFMLNI